MAVVIVGLETTEVHLLVGGVDGGSQEVSSLSPSPPIQKPFPTFSSPQVKTLTQMLP